MKTTPSDRSFGLFASAISIVASLYVLFANQGRGFCFFMLLGVLFLAVAFFVPRVLRPLNRAWFLFGDVLGRIVSPVVLLVIYFVLLTPIGALTRLFGRDELRLRKRKSGSYWVPREQQQVAPDSFKNQY